LYILDAKAPERAKLDIFERVNGGEPLTRQQMRNCLYNGPATRWLKEASEKESFLTVTDGSLQRKTMRDREAINRFCAFLLLGSEEYRGDMDVFLANTLEQMNQVNEITLSFLTKTFDNTMRVNRFLFGKHAFRKSLATGSDYASRSVINIALFDVCSVLLARTEEIAIKENAEKIRNTIKSLINNEEFNHAITYSTNSTRQVKKRFEMAEAAFQEAGIC
jgi:hypothetical protein